VENAIHYATALGGNDIIGAEDCPRRSTDIHPRALARRHIRRRRARRNRASPHLSTLDSVGGNQAQAAKLLGIDRRTLYNKLHQWNVQ
jgi:two-component system response regulator HydG